MATTSPADAALHLLADKLATEDLAPCLVGVVSDNDGFNLHTRPLNGAHPTDLLDGFDAPDRWHAIGVIAEGTAYPVDWPGSTARVRIVTLISRSGEIAHRLTSDDEQLAARLSGEPPSQGEVLDALREALDRPSPDRVAGTDQPAADRADGSTLGTTPDFDPDYAGRSLDELQDAITNAADSLERSGQKDKPLHRDVLACRSLLAGLYDRLPRSNDRDDLGLGL